MTCRQAIPKTLPDSCAKQLHALARTEGIVIFCRTTSRHARDTPASFIRSRVVCLADSWRQPSRMWTSSRRSCGKRKQTAQRRRKCIQSASASATLLCWRQPSLYCPPCVKMQNPVRGGGKQSDMDDGTLTGEPAGTRTPVFMLTPCLDGAEWRLWWRRRRQRPILRRWRNATGNGDTMTSSQPRCEADTTRDDMHHVQQCPVRHVCTSCFEAGNGLRRSVRSLLHKSLSRRNTALTC